MSALLGITARAVLYTMLGVIFVVMILFGLMLYLLLKSKKKSDSVDNNIRYLLARRESQIVVDIMQSEHDEVKRAELVGKLRRVKMAEMLIEELIKEEQGIVSAVEAEENAKKKHSEKAAAPANRPPVSRPAVKPENMPGAEGAPRPAGQPVQRPAGQPVQRPGQPPVQRPAQPVQPAQAQAKPVTEKPAQPAAQPQQASAKPVQPAAKPVQAAEKPVEKPAEKPAAKPEEKPAAQPEKPSVSAPASDKKNVAADKGAEE